MINIIVVHCILKLVIITTDADLMTCKCESARGMYDYLLHKRVITVYVCIFLFWIIGETIYIIVHMCIIILPAPGQYKGALGDGIVK